MTHLNSTRAGALGFFGADAWEAPSPRGPQAPMCASRGEVRPLQARYEALQQAAGPGRNALTLDQGREILAHARTHSVASIDALKRYDPEGIIGFCFGRSMLTHLLARQAGLSESSIKKMFIVGDLRSTDAPEWRFHVTTMVRTDQGWMALDPLLGRIMTAQAWVDKIQSVWDREKKAVLYTTDAKVVVPDLSKAIPIPEETGDTLLELSFDPRARGFAPERLSGQLRSPVWKADSALQSRYFSSSEPSIKGFDFNGATINGNRIPYHGYFDDLFASLEGGTSGSSERKKTAGPTPQDLTPQALYSLRFDRLL
ncbi:MAG: hypothetical protein AAFQ82_15815 [Myxococcota bacterium]